jgi:hypothetical protein
MVRARAKQNRPIFAVLHETGPKSAKFSPMTAGAYQVHSEARGPHWVAWITRGQDTKPERSVVIVAETQALAEAKARQWAEQRL